MYMDFKFLAAAQEGSHTVSVWKLATGKMINAKGTKGVNVLKEQCTFLKWSKSGDELAIGTDKGSLVIYKASSNKSIPLLRKHSKVQRFAHVYQQPKDPSMTKHVILVPGYYFRSLEQRRTSRARL